MNGNAKKEHKMTRTSGLFAAALCLSACVHLGATGLARAEAVAALPEQSVVGDAALEPSSENDGTQALNQDTLRFAQNTGGGQNAQLKLAADKKWAFSVTPYLWMVGLDGDMTVMGVKSDVDVDFGDILDNLDFAFSVHMEAKRGKWGLFFDPTYITGSMDGDVGPTSVDVEVDFALIEFGGFYEVLDRDLGSSGRFHVVGAPLIGLRWIYLDVDINISGPAPPPDAGGSEDWLDLFIGWRSTFTLSPKWTLRTRTDIGGFDIGSSSDFAWNSQILFGYQMTKSATLLFGYRSLDVDYDHGSGSSLFDYDITTSGPVIGTMFRF